MQSVMRMEKCIRFRLFENLTITHCLRQNVCHPLFQFFLGLQSLFDALWTCPCLISLELFCLSWDRL